MIAIERMRYTFILSNFRGFKVVQGHRCWYYWKVRRQCLLW